MLASLQMLCCLLSVPLTFLCSCHYGFLPKQETVVPGYLWDCDLLKKQWATIIFCNIFYSVFSTMLSASNTSL